MTSTNLETPFPEDPFGFGEISSTEVDDADLNTALSGARLSVEGVDRTTRAAAKLRGIKRWPSEMVLISGIGTIYIIKGASKRGAAKLLNEVQDIAHSRNQAKALRETLAKLDPKGGALSLLGSLVAEFQVFMAGCNPGDVIELLEPVEVVQQKTGKKVFLPTGSRATVSRVWPGLEEDLVCVTEGGTGFLVDSRKITCHEDNSPMKGGIGAAFTWDQKRKRWHQFSEAVGNTVEVECVCGECEEEG